jgi:tetratricopeptide (TPR) repeat protein
MVVSPETAIEVTSTGAGYRAVLLVARLEELERKFEENPRRYFAPLANEYRKAGDAQRAAELCRAQLPEVPGHISGHIVLGQALYDAGDFDGSRAALETALALDPENIVALRYLGDIARTTGDAVEAERWYSRTLEADPYNEAAMTALQALGEAPAPAVELTTDELPQPTTDVAVESPEQLPEMDTRAVGFEPTSYAPEAVLSEPAESLSTAVGATSAETAEAAAAEPPSETALETRAEPTETAPEESMEPESRPLEEPVMSSEFGGDLAVSAASETPEPAPDELLAPEPAIVAEAAEPPVASEVAAAEVAAVGAPSTEVAPTQASGEEMEPAAAAPDETPAAEVASESQSQAELAERFDVAAHAPPEPAMVEEALEAEERVLESAAPFVTETMADLYMEQGYPHEALELLLQLAEQRPQDEQLRAKIEHIESVIVARRDAAVAAARAERAETAAAAAATERPADAVEAMEFMESPDAPFDAAVAEIDSSAFAVREPAEATASPEGQREEPLADAPLSVREMFARMDRARPRAAGAVTARPISRRRSDFVPMPDAGDTDASEDPFAFPNAPAPGPVPRTSGPHQTFNPSTADSEDFDAWLRGLKGP